MDTLGLLLKVVVHPANLQDRDGAKLVLADVGPEFPRLGHLWADQAYTGPLLDWIASELGWAVALVERPPRRGFQVTPDGQFQRVSLPAVFEPVPRRGVVEGTQPQDLQCALDVQSPRSHDRTRWAAQAA